MYKSLAVGRAQPDTVELPKHIGVYETAGHRRLKVRQHRNLKRRLADNGHDRAQLFTTLSPDDGVIGSMFDGGHAATVGATQCLVT